MFWSVAILCVALILLGEAAFHIYYGRRILTYFEMSPPFLAPVGVPAPTAELVAFRSGDGVVLRGAIARTDDSLRGLVVFCPETRADFWSYQAYIPEALASGYDILSFDFRNQGFSDADPNYQPLHWLTKFEVQDLEAAIDFARSHERYADVPIVLHGVSRGAGAALHVAATRRDIAGVVTQGAFSCWTLFDHYVRKWKRAVVPRLQYVLPNWHNWITMWVARKMSERRRGGRYVSLESSLPRLRRLPLLWMGTRRDSCIPGEVTETLFALTRHPEEDLWMAPRGRHNGERLAAPEEFDRRLRNFLDRVGLPASSRKPAAAPMPNVA